jgi:hypothetical protein
MDVSVEAGERLDVLITVMGFVFTGTAYYLVNICQVINL